MNPETMKIFSTVTLVEIEPEGSLVKELKEHNGLTIDRMGLLTVEFSDGWKRNGPVISFKGESDEIFYKKAGKEADLKSSSLSVISSPGF